MVKAALCLGMAFASLLAPAAALRAEAAAAPAALEPLAPRPDRPAVQPSAAWEDASAVTLVSLPFTAFWSLLGALAVAGISQHKFPPEMDTPALAGAAAVAGGTSLAIGLLSIHWGGPKKSGD